VSITRHDIAQLIQDQVGVSQREAYAWTQSVIETMIDTLEQGEAVSISGFGVFDVTRRRPRVGRNPRTREPVPIPERHVVTFRASPKLRDRLNPHLHLKQPSRK